MATLEPWDWPDEVDGRRPHEECPGEGDVLIEDILENLNKTPIGEVLDRIAEMPEFRKQKVLDVRRRLSSGQYDLTDRLDEALEKILHDLNP